MTVFVAWLLGKAVHHSNKYSLFTVPASALILFSPTVAPANPWRVPREVKEFMAAPAVELAVDAATESKKKQDKIKAIFLAILVDHKTAYDNTEHNNRATKMKKVNETNRPTLLKILVVQLFMEIVDEIWTMKTGSQNVASCYYLQT